MPKELYLLLSHLSWVPFQNASLCFGSKVSFRLILLWKLHSTNSIAKDASVAAFSALGLLDTFSAFIGSDGMPSCILILLSFSSFLRAGSSPGIFQVLRVDYWFDTRIWVGLLSSGTQRDIGQDTNGISARIPFWSSCPLGKFSRGAEFESVVRNFPAKNQSESIDLLVGFYIRNRHTSSGSRLKMADVYPFRYSPLS
jgi:hypothetical protein